MTFDNKCNHQILLALRNRLHEQTLTLHVLELGIVGREEGENPLRFAVTVYVQLQVGQHGAETGENKSIRRSHPGVHIRERRRI